MPNNNNSWLSAIPMVGSIANAIGNIGTARKNRRFTREENQRQRDWSSQQWEKQNQASIDFWNMQNQYNDPSAQMQRLKDAGLNPNLVYGSGATTQAGPISTHSASQPRTSAEKSVNAVGSSIFDFLNVQQQKANIARTEAETQATEAQTANREFLNKLNDDSWLTNLKQRMNAGAVKEMNEALAGSYSNDVMGYLQQNWKTLKKGGKVQDMRIGNNFMFEARKAGLDLMIQQAENAKKLGDSIGLKNAFQAYMNRLQKRGLNMNSSFISQLFNGIWYSIFREPLINTSDTIIERAKKQKTN